MLECTLIVTHRYTISLCGCVCQTLEVVSPPPGLPEIARQLSGAMELPGPLSTADSQLGTARVRPT